jgi:hypothetical protein
VEVQSKLWRIGQFVAVVVGAAVLYFGALALGGSGCGSCCGVE